jgi:hypothetical protein
VVVRSEPPGAAVSVDGKPAGTTPTIIDVALPHEVWLALDGYHATREVVTVPGEITVRLVSRRKAPAPNQRFLDE